MPRRTLSLQHRAREARLGHDEDPWLELQAAVRRTDQCAGVGDPGADGPWWRPVDQLQHPAARPARGDGSRARGRSADARRVHRKLQGARSEEHTSELQSLMRISYAVFCLKKKNT